MTLRITRLHDWARRAKTVLNERADYDAALRSQASLDELIDAFLESVGVFSRYEPEAGPMFKKTKPGRASAPEPPAGDPAAPVPLAVFAAHLQHQPGPHQIDGDAAFTYVTRDLYPHTGRSSANNYEGPALSFDFVLKGPEGRPLLAQYKAADDMPPYGALVQLLALSSMMANPLQMARLQASCPQGFPEPPAIPIDLALIFNRNGRTKNPIFAKNWDDSLVCVRAISDRLVKSGEVSRYIRQIRLLRADFSESRFAISDAP